jgi:hypothetical protein
MKRADLGEEEEVVEGTIRVRGDSIGEEFEEERGDVVVEPPDGAAKSTDWCFWREGARVGTNLRFLLELGLPAAVSHK